MFWLWGAAALCSGAAIGLFFGRLMAAVVAYWESTRTAVRSWMAATTFAFGGGTLGGTALFQFLAMPDVAPFYLLGWGIGALIAYFFPRIPQAPNPEQISQALQINSGIPPSVQNMQDRARAITLLMAPAKKVARDSRVSQQQLAISLENMIDQMIQAEDEPERGE